MDTNHEVRALAERQHAVVARWQANSVGGNRWKLDRWFESPDWVEATCRVLRLVGAPQTDYQRLKIFELDSGPDAVLSHDSAAALWGLPGFRFGPLEATLLRGVDGRTSSIGTLHRPRLLLPHHTTLVQGIRTTTVARTLFDEAGRLHPRRTPVVVDRVIGQSPGVLVSLHKLLPELAQRGRPGIRVMRQVLEKRPLGYRPNQTGVEIRFDTILEEAGEAPMDRQVDLGGHEWIGRVDKLDRELKLITEIDSVAHHTSPTDIANDERRDRDLKAEGFRDVLRIASEDVWSRPAHVVQQVRQKRRELRRSAPPRSGTKNVAETATFLVPECEG